MSSARFALTPVIAIRDSDEITAVWLVPQLVLLKTSQQGKQPSVPSGGVRNEEDMGGISGYNREISRQRRTAPENRVPAELRSEKHIRGVRRASRAVLSPSGFPSGECKITQR